MNKRKMKSVIGIALLSSMTLSSVPAMIPSVSAMEAPALLDDGKIEMTDNGSFNPLFPDQKSTMHLVVPAEGEAPVFHLGTDLNTIGNQLCYVDLLGRKIDVTANKVTWSVTDGGNYVSVKSDGTLKAKHDANKQPGKATIQMKVGAVVNLGEGRGTKRLTYTKNFTAYVYEEGETYLGAFHGGSQIQGGDLTDLAAYGDTATFRLWKARADENGLLKLEESDYVKQDAEKNFEEVRFYAGDASGLFDREPVGEETKGETFKKGAKKDIEIAINKESEEDTPAEVTLRTNGTVGKSMVQAVVKRTDGKQESYKLEVGTSKRVNTSSDSSIVIDRKGGKTLMTSGSEGIYRMDEKTDLTGFTLKATGTGVNITVENGQLDAITASNTNGSIVVRGGKTGNISAKKADVHICEDGITGNISGKTVLIEENAQTGKVTSNANGSVQVINGGTVTGIDADGTATVQGGTVAGDVKSKTEIVIEPGEDSSRVWDTLITGNVIGSSSFSEDHYLAKNNVAVTVDNQSDGDAQVNINGNVIARFSKEIEEPTVRIGSEDTSGLIQIGGNIQGEKVEIGGKGWVAFSGLKASDEVAFNDPQNQPVDSYVIFSEYQGNLDRVEGFSSITLENSTLTLNKEIQSCNTLDLDTGSQLVCESGVQVDTLRGNGQLVTQAGKLKISRAVGQTPSVLLLGNPVAGEHLYTAPKDSDRSIILSGLSTTASRQDNREYHYFLSKTADLPELYALGKQMSLLAGQSQQVCTAIPGREILPNGTSIRWSSEQEGIARVVGNGTSAVIQSTGKTGTTVITASLVDETGKVLPKGTAKFYVTVREKLPSVVKLDAQKVDIQVGKTYGLCVKGNNDIEGLKTSTANSEVAGVSLYNGADPRGAIYLVFGLKEGETKVSVTYQGLTSVLLVKVVAAISDSQ